MNEIEAFWADAQVRAKVNPLRTITGPNLRDTVPPPAWSFGADPQQADELLALVLAGIKTATASSRWDYDAEDEALPEVGELSIVLDGAGHPRALVRTTDVQVVRFGDVDADHAYAEGEGDRSLAYWREVHEAFFTEHASHDHGFSDDLPVVLERFEVLVTNPGSASRA
ncbi:ASCH domain-containing protein [Parenemella sanctibonifatiensis]|uniref:ASCH domain-containing protein n=1 Tax=Parenemella sanctibonifatiensis TaxID=2016505 RepID=A0A255EFA4_9ACTN|nr:ASCH domain-containing protein [Parenemella sanctibonifatiensis]OYN88265.1 ASCH domain-containing protein [Parenemella sanctibonifatiensis]